MNNNSIRLQKYLASCGIASRRKCEILIAEGKICVNNIVQTKLGTKINPKIDIVKYNGKIVKPKNTDTTIILNKPAGYVSTMSDPQCRPCVKDLVPVMEYPSLFPVGRLDRLTTGLLVFTTDGQLGQKLLHPSHEVNKTYNAVIKGKLTKNSKAYKILTSGMEILGQKTDAAQIYIKRYIDFAKYQQLENDFFKNCASKFDQDCLPSTKDLINCVFTDLDIVIHEGKNRQIRRMFSSVAYEVLLLKREKIGNLSLNNLEYGRWQKLEPKDIKLMTS